MSCSGADSANAIMVKETATVPLYFMSVFGFRSMPIAATAMASARGGGQGPLDIAIIIDTTGSMNNTDSSCSGNTQIACALGGAQTLMKGLFPCSQSLSTCGAVTSGNVANPIARVSLFVFPGMSSSTQAQYDYDRSGSTTPQTLSYSGYSYNSSNGTYTLVGTPLYEELPLQSDYKTSDSATSLNTASNLSKSVGAGGASCTSAMQAPGGWDTYYADVITAAQSYLTTSGSSKSQKVIIFLSDADATASSVHTYKYQGKDVNVPNLPASKVGQECHAGITAAQAATAAGTWVYTIAYGASANDSTSKSDPHCTSDTSPTISPCVTMKTMASDTTKFYADTQGTSSCTNNAGSTSSLNEIFTQIEQDVTKPRLIPNTWT